MLLRRLEFSGIGPFAGRHLIDMDALSAHHVFLIEGPTGSGKSSIIDAIVFALYGGVAGKESSDKRMRSSHAPLREESWVDLVFTTASGTYRVRRYPAQTIAKKRGNGTRELTQRASLWRLSEAAVDAQEWDSGEPLATQSRETSQIIQDIVGISKDQFVQTVVLPQGQFADFLRLNSKDRSALLERIFHTANYRDFMEDLKAQAKGAQAHIEQAYATYSSAFNVWLNNDGFSEKSKQDLEKSRMNALRSIIPDSSDSDKELLARAQTACESLNHASKEAQSALHKAQEEEQLAQAAAEKGTRLAQALKKKADLLERQAELEKRQPDIESLQCKLDRHNQASIPLLRQKDASQSHQALEKAQQAVHEATRKETIGHQTVCSEKTEESSAQEEFTHENVEEKLRYYDLRINETGELLGQTSALLEEEKSLHERESDHRNLVEKNCRLNDAVASINEKLAAFPQKIEALSEQKKAAQELAEKEQTIAHELENTRALIEIANRHAQASIQAEETGKALRQALNEQENAKAEFDRCTAQWVASAAANLAQQLENDHACPVCGSKNHPAPAQPTESHTDLAHVDQAQKDLEHAHATLNDARNTHLSAQAMCESLASQLGEHTRQSLEKRSEDLEKEILRTHTAGEEALALNQKIEALIAQQRTAQEDLANTKENAAAMASMIKECETTIKKQKAKIVQAQENFPSIEAKYAALVSQRDQLQHERKLYAQLSKALTDDEQTSQAAAEALQQSPFTSLEDAEKAYLSSELFSTYQKEISDYHDALSGVKAQLADPEIAQLSGKEKVDCEKLENQFAQKKAEYANAQRHATLSQQYASEAQRALSKLRTASKHWHAAADSAGAISRLASIATAGESSLSNIPLNIWVLLKRFEIVVARANEHLEEISGGRYELKRVDESSGNRKAGLDLRVIDREGSDRGDEERETSSLSGGETFYTSLALALALAEVVQEEQGGIRIDTLLIDEGFGTLSDDVREAVMRTLTSLSANGRVVGIVSHIEELKKMVPNRITVQRKTDGSSTLSVTA